MWILRGNIKTWHQYTIVLFIRRLWDNQSALNQEKVWINVEKEEGKNIRNSEWIFQGEDINKVRIRIVCKENKRQYRFIYYKLSYVLYTKIDLELHRSSFNSQKTL